MIALRALLVAVFVLLTSVTLYPATAADGIKNIYLVTWRGFEQGCEGFKEYLDNRGLKYKLIHRDAARDKKKLPGFVAEIKKLKPDLVVTWGTSVSVGILGTYDAVDPARNVTDIPAVFMFPTNPQRSKLVPNYESSGRNVTGVRYVLTEQQQLSVAMDSLKFIKLGIVANSDEVNVTNSVKAMRRAAGDLGVEIIVEPVTSAKGGAAENALAAALKKLKAAGAEVVYFPPSSMLNAHSNAFTEAAVKLGLPIFSSGQNPVRKGKAAIGVGVSYRQTGKRAAVLAEKILRDGAKPADLSIDAPEEFGVVVNMSVVNELGLEISPDIIRSRKLSRTESAEVSEAVGGEAPSRNANRRTFYVVTVVVAVVLLAMIGLYAYSLDKDVQSENDRVDRQVSASLLVLKDQLRNLILYTEVITQMQARASKQVGAEADEWAEKNFESFLINVPELFGFALVEKGRILLRAGFHADDIPAEAIQRMGRKKGLFPARLVVHREIVGKNSGIRLLPLTQRIAFEGHKLFAVVFLNSAKMTQLIQGATGDEVAVSALVDNAGRVLVSGRSQRIEDDGYQKELDDALAASGVKFREIIASKQKTAGSELNFAAIAASPFPINLIAGYAPSLDFSQQAGKLALFAGGTTAGFVLFVFFFYRTSDHLDAHQYRLEGLVEERTAELGDAYNVISGSIKYASRIQRSVLPGDQVLTEAFGEHFVIWSPRDVVGGDFYWCHDWGDGVLLILGDCTGHGVPGAFMTLISTGALDRALVETPPGAVGDLVGRMHRHVQRTLGQDRAEAESDNGLELGACFIAADRRSMTFVGARFDLFVVDGGEVRRHRGDKKGIGYREIASAFEFSEVHIDLSPSAVFYLTTDGAVDQIGAETQRRFGKRRFGNLLLEVHEAPLPAQKEAIRGAIDDFQGDEERLDDVAIIGFKVA